MGAAFHHRAGGGQVVAEAAMRQVSRAKARRVDCATHPPVVAANPFWLVDRAGRLKDPPRASATHQSAPADGGEAAERVHAGLLRTQGLLPLQQLALADHRQSRQCGAAGDAAGVNAGQRLRKSAGVGLGVAHVGRQRRHQRGLAFGRITAFQQIKKGEFSHHGLSIGLGGP